MIKQQCYRNNEKNKLINSTKMILASASLNQILKKISFQKYPVKDHQKIKKAKNEKKFKPYNTSSDFIKISKKSGNLSMQKQNAKQNDKSIEEDQKKVDNEVLKIAAHENSKGCYLNIKPSKLRTNITMIQNVISDLNRYSQLSPFYGVPKIKNFASLSSQNENSQEKFCEFSTIHEKLTKKISQVNTSNPRIEMLISMSETYFEALSEISGHLDKEISCILNASKTGLENIIEALRKKALICEKEAHTELLNEKNKNEEMLNNKIKEEEVKIINLNMEIENMKKENLEIKSRNNKISKDKFHNQIVQTEESIFKPNDYFPSKNLEKILKNQIEINHLKKDLTLHKKRANKLIYFFNLIEEKGIKIKTIYEREVRSISTDRFTDRSISDQSLNSESHYENKPKKKN